MYSGNWLPIVTPFKNGEIDITALQRLADSFLGSGHIDGIVALGTTGEAALLSRVERVAVLQALSDVVAGHLPLLVGVGGPDTREVIAEIRQYEPWDCAGYLVSAPSYVCPDQAGIQWHFEQVARATERPLVLYNVPHRTGVAIAVDTVARLVERGNIVAIKECVSGNFAALHELPIAVLCGTDEAYVDCLVAGGVGGVLASVHVCGELFADVRALVTAGRKGEARALFATVLPLLRVLFSAPNPSAIKAALMLQRGFSDETRMPVRRASRELIERVRVALDQLTCERAALPALK